ncbi:hypothetical protein C0995_016209 [Termitomyces sp. Mi166|nr:hypothetical protein C0995_016209 [Termitomyces sp. Mi166\
MFTKISLLKVSAGASLLEHKLAVQDFVIAADNAFYKAQGLAMLVPLHKMMAIELKLTVPAMVPKASVAPAPTPISAALLIRHMPSISYVAEPSGPPMHLYSELSLQEQEEVCAVKSKEKAKVVEEDDDNEDEATQMLRKELENFVVPITCGQCVANNMAEECWYLTEGFKGKGKSKALITKSEQTGAKRAFKSKETVASDSNKEEEEERVCMIKKIKHKHVKELIGVSKRKEVGLQMAVASKTPMAGPLCSISEPVVLIPSMPKSVPKVSVVLTTPVAGPSTLQTILSSVPKTIATAPKPVSVMSTGKLAIEGGSVIKDPFMVRQFKLVGIEESGTPIINQATEVSSGKVAGDAMQETL